MQDKEQPTREQEAAKEYADKNWKRQINDEYSIQKVNIEAFEAGAEFSAHQSSKEIERLSKEYGSLLEESAGKGLRINNLKEENSRLTKELQEVKGKAEKLADCLEGLNKTIDIEWNKPAYSRFKESGVKHITNWQKWSFNALSDYRKEVGSEA